MQHGKGSVTITSGVRVAVTPGFQPEQSDPEIARFVFSYRIRITNESDRPVQLRSRHWIIIDADGERHDVEGEGVVGQQPRIEPGEAFAYSSFCPLGTAWGTMEGTYSFVDADGEEFPVQVGRFFLVMTPQDAATP